MLMQRRKKEGLAREKQDIRHYMQAWCYERFYFIYGAFPFPPLPSPLEQKIEVTDS